jgi:RNA polymerase sigma-70 factor (ECF subfamily)
MAATDPELIDRCRQGDSASFATLATRWGGPVYALAYRLLQDAHLAEDARQTALLRAYARLEQFNGRAAFSTWLFRIVVNVCRDWQRSSRARDHTADNSADTRPSRASAARGAAALEGSETARRVAAAVRGLPSSAREVVVMRHYMELKFADIAAILEVPVSTVKSRMSNGLRLLREALQEDES